MSAPELAEYEIEDEMGRIVDTRVPFVPAPVVERQRFRLRRRVIRGPKDLQVARVTGKAVAA